MTLGILLVFLKLLLLVSAFPTSIVDADQNLTSLVARDGRLFNPNYVLDVQVTEPTFPPTIAIDVYRFRTSSPEFRYSTTLRKRDILRASFGRRLLITPVAVGPVNSILRTALSKQLHPFFMDVRMKVSMNASGTLLAGISFVRLESPCEGTAKEMNTGRITFPVYIERKKGVYDKDPVFQKSLKQMSPKQA